MTVKDFYVKSGLQVSSNVVVGTYTSPLFVPQQNSLVVSGNIGVGTSLPDSRLDVVGGNIHVHTSNAGIVFSDGTFQTTAVTATPPGGTNRAVQFNDSGVFGGDVNKFSFDTNGNVGIGTNSTTYKLQVNGSFAAITKSFVIDHPTNAGMKLRYGSLESPYHGVRLTGDGEIQNGMVTIKLPSYISNLCKAEGAQVQLTNIRHGKTLWIEDLDIDNNQFIVACDSDYIDNKTYKFYWSFTGIRKDIGDLLVEYYETV